MMKEIEGVLGRGWSFPPEFSPSHGVIMATDYHRIQQSLRIIFSTLPGERIMREAFGCDFHQFMFQNIGDDLVARISRAIEDAVHRDEPRIELLSLDVQKRTSEPYLLEFQVVYRVRGSSDIQRFSASLDMSARRSWEGVWVS
ncbi:phage baseplate protein [Escherichia sp. E1130]|nr:phage baseplate protein [Escherichia sp. E1130]TLI62173.1 GPW/gp25 family protein [Escherichia sp. E1130]